MLPGREERERKKRKRKRKKRNCIAQQAASLTWQRKTAAFRAVRVFLLIMSLFSLVFKFFRFSARERNRTKDN